MIVVLIVITTTEVVVFTVINTTEVVVLTGVATAEVVVLTFDVITYFVFKLLLLQHRL